MHILTAPPPPDPTPLDFVVMQEGPKRFVIGRRAIGHGGTLFTALCVTSSPSAAELILAGLRAGKWVGVS